jgi:hypothetical protein
MIKKQRGLQYKTVRMIYSAKQKTSMYLTNIPLKYDSYINSLSFLKSVVQASLSSRHFRDHLIGK